MAGPWEKYAPSAVMSAEPTDAPKPWEKYTPSAVNAPTPEKMSMSEVGMGVLTNAVPSAVNQVKGLWHAVTHPADTGMAILDVGAAGLRAALPRKMVAAIDDLDRRLGNESTTERIKQTGSATADYLADRYGSIEGVKRAVATDPVGVLADASTVLAGVGGAVRMGTGVTAATMNAVGQTGKAATLASKGAAVADAVARTAGAIDPMGQAIKLGARAVPAASRGVLNVADAVSAFTSSNGGRRKAGKILREAAGDNLEAVKAQLAQASPDLTASQAAYGSAADTFHALGENIAARDPSGQYLAKMDAQRAADIDAVSSAASGTTQVETADAVAQARKAINAATTPMRDAVIQQIRQDQLAAISAAGLPPLKVDTLARRIDAVSSNPKIKVDKAAVDALNAVKQSIQDWTDNVTDVIDPETLMAIRERGVAIMLDKMNPGLDTAEKNKVAAKLMVDVKKAIDESLNAATGGTKWSDYLAQHEGRMHDVNRQQFASLTRDALNSGPEQYLKLVRGDNVAKVEDVFGPNRYDPATQMQRRGMTPDGNVAPDRWTSLDTAAKNIERDLDIKRRAQSAIQPTAEILDRNSSKMRLPALFSREVAITNRVMKELEGKFNQKTLRALNQSMLDGKSALDAINDLPMKDRARMLKFLTDKGVPLADELAGRGRAAAVSSVGRQTMPTEGGQDE